MLPATIRMPTTSVREVVRELRPAGAVKPAGHRWLTALLVVTGAALVGVLLASHGHEFVDALGRALHTGWWAVALGAACEAASLAGYVLLLHHVVGKGSARLRVKDSYDIALGGTAATRLLPTAGVGGVAVAVWALRARGVRPRELTERLLAFLLLLYGVYMAALFASGAAVGLGRGLGVGPNGHLYVVNPASNSIAEFSGQGTLIKELRPPLGTALGQFNQPSAVDVGPDNSIFMLDNANQRIEKLAR